MKLCMGCMNQIEDHLFTCPHCGFNEADLKQESYYLTPGTVMGGKYIIGKVLSYGGHTISYLGYDAEKNMKVVVKEYLPSDFSTRSEGETDITIYSGDAREQFEQGLTNFLNEANRIQQLGKMEGIAQVYDCVAENDTGYVISEYLDGKTLKELLDSGKKYTVEETRVFIESILRGLSKVHPLDIVHCDIAPETIMVTDSGEIKLLDFGATRYVTTANSKSLAIILKQGYAPEEQYRSRGVRGPWTDVYAVAAVMYRMITGIAPQESVERALVDDLKEPSKLGIAIPESTENALMNALNVYKDERTSSAEIFLKELTDASVKRIKVKKRKNETGKFPLWAKGLVACLLLAVVVGGVALFKMSGDENGELASNDIILQSMETKTLEDAKNYIAELNETNGWDLEVEASYVYTNDESQNGKISGQENIPDSFNFTSLLNDAETANTQDNYGLKVADGAISGTITYQIYRDDAIYYSEIKGLNAYTLTEKIGFDRNNKNKFVEDKETVNKNYFDLAEIVTTDGTITVADIETSGNEQKEIKIADIEKIVYYASEFFYWEELDNFEGMTVDELPDYQVWKMANEKEMKLAGEKSLLETTLIDQSYLTFDGSKYKKGYIFEQTVPAGEKLDLRTDMEKLQNGALLYAIEQVISTSGTGYDVESRIGWANTTIVRAGSGDPTQKVLSVKVVNNETGKEVSEFKKTDSLTITLILQKKPVVKKKAPEKQVEPAQPSPAPSPQPQEKPKIDNNRVAD